jgi:hypothetical protein
MFATGPRFRPACKRVLRWQTNGTCRNIESVFQENSAMKCVALYFIDITPICSGQAHAKSGVAKRARVDLN